MMDHLSSKVCAAAGSTCIPMQTGTVAITTIIEKRIAASQTERKSKWTMQIHEAVFLHMEKLPCRQKVNITNTQNYPIHRTIQYTELSNTQNYDVGRCFRRTAYFVQRKSR